MDIRKLQAHTITMLHKVEKANDLRTALTAVREVRQNIALLLETRGQLDRRPQVNLVLSLEWLELKALIVTALEPHPEARDSVVRANAGAGNGQSRR